MLHLAYKHIAKSAVYFTFSSFTCWIYFMFSLQRSHIWTLKKSGMLPKNVLICFDFELYSLLTLLLVVYKKVFRHKLRFAAAGKIMSFFPPAADIPEVAFPTQAPQDGLQEKEGKKVQLCLCLLSGTWTWSKDTVLHREIGKEYSHHAHFSKSILHVLVLWQLVRRSIGLAGTT